MVYYHLAALYSIASTMMDCAIEMQLHSHGLVKNLRHYNKEAQPENHYVITSHKNDIKLF